MRREIYSKKCSGRRPLLPLTDLKGHEKVAQGGARGSFPSLALGYRLTPRWGSIRKKRLLPLHKCPISPN